MTYSVIRQELAVKLGTFVAADDESALRYVKQNYDPHHDEVLIVRNTKTNRIITYI